jgi:hypothetical protein
VALYDGVNSITSGTAVFSNANGVSFGFNGQTITGSIVPGGSNVAISAGANSQNTGTVVFSNANGISFGLDNAGNITATVQPGAAAGIAAVQLPNTTYTSGTFQFFNSNNFTFLSTTGQGVVGSFSQSVQTQASGAIAGTGFTSTTTAGAVLVGTNSTNGLSLGVPNWLTTQTVQTQASGNIGATGFATTTTNGVVIVGTNNTTGMTLAVPPYITTYVAQTVQAQTLTVSAANTSYTVPNLSFSNANNVSFSLSNNSQVYATASFAQSVQTQASGNIPRSGFTTGATAGSQLAGTHDTAGLSLGVPAWITTYAAQSVQAQTLTVSAANTSYTVPNLSFSNNGNVSFSLSNNSQVYATATFPAQTVQPVNASAANGSVNFSTLSFSNVNGVSFVTAAGPAIQASIATTYAGTGVTTASTAGSDLAATLNTSGLSLGVPKWLTAGGGDGYNIVSVGTSTFGGGTGGATTSWLSTTLGFYAGSNITLSQTSNSIIWYAPTPGAAQESNAFNLLGNNTAGNTTATGSTIGLSGLNMTLSGTNNSQIVLSVPATSSLSATGIVSISTNASTISIGVPAPAFSASGGSSSFGTLNFSNNAYASWTNTVGQVALAELRGSFFAAGNTTQASSGTQNLDAVTLSGGGMAAVGVSNGSLLFNVGTGTTITGGASITLGSAGISFNGLDLVGSGAAITGRASITANSQGISFNGLSLAGVGTGTAKTGNIALTLTADSSSIALSINANSLMGTGFTTGSTTGAWSATGNSAGLSMVQPYLTRMILPADEQVTAVVSPTNASMTFRYVDQQAFLTASRMDMLIGMSFSTTAGAGTQTLQESRYAVIYTKNGASLSSLSSGSTQTTWTMASNTAGQTQLSQAAVRYVSVPVNVNMQPGEYYVGVNYITAGTAVSLTQSIYGGNDIQTASQYADMASTTNATTGQLWGAMGCYSVASTGMPGALSISAIVQTAAALSAANIALVFRNA